MRSILILGVIGLVGCSEQGFGEDEQKNWNGEAPPLSGEQQVDEYVQVQPTQADVLFVISNWWSMEQAYAELVDSFDELLDVFVGSGIDYHIGVISTDTDHSYENGRLHDAFNVRWIDTETPLPLTVFAEMATMNASGCVGPRRPRDATYKALEYSANGWNDGFRRPEASMHTVFVSDDTDQSSDLSFDEWVDWYQHWTETPDMDTLSTIVDMQADQQNVLATDIIGGTSHPIQTQPWANVMELIGLKAQGLRQEFSLTRQAVEGTIEVSVIVGSAEAHYYEGEEADGDWWYDETRNSIHFHTYKPPEKARVQLTYEIR